jgi:hypothetical protein
MLIANILKKGDCVGAKCEVLFLEDLDYMLATHSSSFYVAATFIIVFSWFVDMLSVLAKQVCRVQTFLSFP